MSWLSNQSQPMGGLSNTSLVTWRPAIGLGLGAGDILERLEKTRHGIEGLEEPCNIAKNIGDHYLWILCVLGIPGNVITIITILTMQAMSPATFFVALLAFFDGAALLMKAIFFFPPHFKVMSISNAYCKMEFLVIACATIANWMLVLICMERFVSVCFPLKKVYLFTKKRSYILAIAVIVFFLLGYTPLFMEMRAVEDTGTMCETKSQYLGFWVPYYFALNAAFFLFIPFLIILALTIAIVRGLYVSRRDRRSLMRKGSKNGSGTTGNDRSAMNNQRLLAETERTERTITIMMILAASLFVILALPACIYTIGAYYNNTYASACHSSKLSADWTLFRQVQFVIIDSSHAINFCLYFLAAKRFRVHLFKMLRCKTCKKQKYKTKHQNTYSTQLSSSSRVTHSITPHSPVIDIS